MSVCKKCILSTLLLQKSWWDGWGGQSFSQGVRQSAGLQECTSLYLQEYHEVNLG